MKGIFRAGAWAGLVAAVGLGAWAGPATAASARYSLLSRMPGQGLMGDTEYWLPYGGLVLGEDGTAYGLAAQGGWYGSGGVYAVSPSGVFSTYRDLGQDTGRPERAYDGNYLSLVRDADGSMYGITHNEGPIDDQRPPVAGTVFKIGPDGSFSTLHAFYEDGEGAHPKALVGPADGVLYGLTEDGIVFRVTTDGVERTLYDFGYYAPTAITMDKDGNVVGSVTTLTPPRDIPLPGIFKLTPDGQLSLLHALDQSCDSEGFCHSTARVNYLVTGADGTIYGLTTGVAYKEGAVFKLATDGTFTILHAFDNAGAKEGFNPQTLTVGSDGNLYGTTCCGGTGGPGTLFRVTPTGVFTVLKQFDGDDALLEAPFSLTQSGPRTFLAVADPGASYSGVYKLVVPVPNDVDGSGASSAITAGTSSVGLLRFQADGTYQRNAVASANGAYPVSTGDLNGDGIADTILTNKTVTNGTRPAYVWYGGAVPGAKADSIAPYPVGWRLVGTGDVNGDGKDDLLWMNDGTHQFAYWTMNSAHRTGSRTFKITPGYFPVLTGDFNGDGRADILWSSSRRDLYLWSGTGTGFSSKLVTVYPAGWSVAGRGDLDGNGSDDIVWNTVDHSKWGYWLMKGAKVRKSVSFAVPSALAGYSIGDVADFNGDGVADLLWSNGTFASFQANQGVCSATVPCSFATRPSVAWPSGQKLFNAGLATGGK